MESRPQDTAKTSQHIRGRRHLRNSPFYNPAMPRSVWCTLQLPQSFSYGVRLCSRPPMQPTPKNPSLCCCFPRFWGSGAGKKDAKIPICFWKSILNNCFTVSRFFAALGKQKHRKIQCFFRFAYRNYILQHGENCVNTSVFARHRHKNTVNTVVLGFPRR